jgi:hypothetical protein
VVAAGAWADYYSTVFFLHARTIVLCMCIVYGKWVPKKKKKKKKNKKKTIKNKKINKKK